MIPLIKTTFYNEVAVKQELGDFLTGAPRLSMGFMCKEFESRFAKFQGRKYAVLVNSGGSANLALLQSLKNLGRIKEGDAVGFSAVTWSTNVMPIIQMGFDPVPVDCDPIFLNVTSTTFADTLKSQKLDALFITNALGLAGDLDEIRELCRAYNIMLLEDNCESMGTELTTGMTGNFGLAGTFSMYVAHQVSTVEGGVICTDDDKLEEMLKIVRANGWDRNLTKKRQLDLHASYSMTDFDGKYAFYDLAYNLKPTEITGFLGLRQLEHLQENITRRESNFALLDRSVAANPDLVRIYSYFKGGLNRHITRLSSFAFPIICKTPELKAKYLKRFEGSKIEVRPIISGNIQRQPFYQKCARKKYDLPGADFLHDCGFYCPNRPDLTENELRMIADCLNHYSTKKPGWYNYAQKKGAQ